MPNIDLGKVVGAQGPEGPVAQGTMMEATYDPNGKSQDVFAYADAAKQEAKDYAAPKTHASQHARGGSDPLTLANIAFLGDNPIASTADDTTSNWAALGSGYAFYKSTGQLIDQPSAWGILVSFICGSDIFQIWKTQNNGPVYTRSGNASGWSQTWTKVYDTLNKPTASDIGAAASSHNHSASDITSGTLPVARGGTGQTSLANLVTQLGSNGATRITSGTYVGTGTRSFTINFAVNPKIVIIPGSYVRVFAYGGNSYLYGSETFYTGLNVKWNSVNSVTLSTDSGADTQYAYRWENASGTTYTYYVIY